MHPQTRLGSIEFINSLPVDWGLLSGAVPSEVSILQASPARLNQEILEGGLDISPVSVFWYAEHHEKLLLLPDLSISSQSGVQSVLLFSRFDLPDLRERQIALTGKGRTTPALLEILCRYRHRFIPHFVPVHPECLEIPKGSDALLLIGDEALMARGGHKDSEIRVIDLAEEWWKWTALPIVFAVWAVRRDYFESNRQRVYDAYRALIRSRDWGLSHLEEILETAQKKLGLSRPALKDYFSFLYYHLDTDLLQGTRLFFNYALKCGLLESMPSIETILDVDQAVTRVEGR